MRLDTAASRRGVANGTTDARVVEAPVLTRASIYFPNLSSWCVKIRGFRTLFPEHLEGLGVAKHFSIGAPQKSRPTTISDRGLNHPPHGKMG